MLAVDRAGNVYISDGIDVRRVDRAGRISLFAGSESDDGFAGDHGRATKALLADADGLAVGSNETCSSLTARTLAYAGS